MKFFILIGVLCFCCSCSAISPATGPVQAVMTEQMAEPQLSAAEEIFLDEDKQDWLWTAVYLIAAFAGGWYFSRTGKRSETLTQITDAAGKRLPLKQSIVAKIVQTFFRRKKKK